MPAMWRKLGQRDRRVSGYSALDVTQTRWVGLRGRPAEARAANQIVFDDVANEKADAPDRGGGDSIASELTRKLSTPMSHHRRNVTRLVDRDAPEFQARGKFNIRKRHGNQKLLWNDFYHVLLSLKTRGIVLFFWMLYIVSFLFFAVFWWWLNDVCDVGLNSFLAAFYFSVETQMSIGFGAKDQFFDNCWEVSILMPVQAILGLVLDFVIVAVVFEKTSRISNRALTVIFSDTAVLQVDGGHVRLEFRVAEMASRRLLQAVIQVYVVQHHEDLTSRKSGKVSVEVAAIELQEPERNDQTGVLFFGLPTTAAHRIDRDSPLAPPTVCDRDPEPQEVLEYLRGKPWLEIVVLVSGIEDSSACSVEARHSYTLDDIFWDRCFAPCVSIDKDGWHTVDFEALHETVPASWGDVAEADRRVNELVSGRPPLRDPFSNM